MADPRDVLARLAFGTAVLGESPARARAWDRAARVARKYGAGLEAAYESGELASVRGIGPGVLAAVGAALDGRPVEALQRLEEVVPVGLFEVRRVRGLGVARTRRLWLELDLTSLAEIEYACREGRLAALPGFGVRTQEQVRASITALRERAGKARMDLARGVVDDLARQLRACPSVQRVVVAGQVRRGLEVVDSIDLLVLGSPPTVEAAALGVPVRVHVCGEAERWGADLVRATGPQAHVEALQARGPLEGADEEAVYRGLGLHPTPPERRGAGPLLELGRPRPRLLRREDLCGALHNHTTASDGVNTLAEMHAAATALGLGWIGVADHSASAGYAGGLQPARLLAQVEEIEALNARGEGCHVLSGVESDILRDGELDYDPAVLARLDVVVASVHARYGLDRDAMTRRFLRVARNPWTDVVGHPTGRLLLGRPPVEMDVVALLEACAASGCAVELNANPQRLDLNESWLALAKELGVVVSIAADAHSTGALAHLDYGVTIARRAGLTAEDVLNSRSLEELRAWLGSLARRVGRVDRP